MVQGKTIISATNGPTVITIDSIGSLTSISDITPKGNRHERRAEMARRRKKQKGGDRG